jgi:hypothetical protein
VVVGILFSHDILVLASLFAYIVKNSGVGNLTRLSVFILDTTLALVVDERSAGGALASIAAEHRNLAIGSSCCSSAASGTTAKEEEDCCKKHGCPGTPGEPKCISANAGILSVRAELIASFNKCCAEGVLVMINSHKI